MFKKFFVISTIFVLLLSFIPAPLFATQSESVSNEVFEVIKLKEEVALDDSLSLPIDTFVLANVINGEYFINYKGETINLEKNAYIILESSQDFEEDLLFAKDLQEKVDVQTQLVNKENLISFNGIEININNETELDIYSHEDNDYTVIAGFPYEVTLKEEVQIENPTSEIVDSNTRTSEDNATDHIEVSTDEDVNLDEEINNEIEESTKDDLVTDNETNTIDQETVSSEEMDSSDSNSDDTNQVVDEEKSEQTLVEEELNNESKDNSDSQIMSTFSTQKVQDVWSNSNASYFKVNVYSLPVYISVNGDLYKKAELRENQVYKIKGSISNWHIIDFNGHNAYVWKDSTTPYTGSIPANATTSSNYGSTIVQIVNNAVIYDNTSGSMVPFGMLMEGVNYTIISKVGNWYKVNYINRIGYVHENGVRRDFNSSDEYFKVNVYSLPVYESINGELVKVGEMRKDQVYKRTGTAGNWHAIQFGNKTNYVWSDDTSPASKSDASPHATTGGTSGTFTTNSHAVVYDNSTGKMKPIGQINQGQVYPYELIAGNWIKVSFGNRYGYVYNEWVDFNFKSSDQYFKVNTDYLPVYHNVNGKLLKVGHLSVDQTYKRIGEKGDWHQIQFGNKAGYVWGKSTQPSTQSAVKNWNDNLTNSKAQLIANGGVKVYDNTSGMVLFARVEEGTILPIVDKLGSWYRVLIGNRIGYVYETSVSENVVDNTAYNVSLNDVVNTQLNFNPQTDDHTYAYVHKDYVTSNGIVTATSLHVRDIPGGNSYGQIISGTQVNIVGTSSMNTSWYKIINPFRNHNGFMNADKDQLLYYMNPSNFINDPIQKLQFLRLDLFTSIEVNQLSKVLTNKGILSNKASVFSNAARNVGINEVYLVAHALLETGNGTSELATGVPIMIERDKNGNPIVEDGITRTRLATSSEKPDSVVYNVYGIGAFDKCAKRCGSEYAFNAGWTTIDKAIVGGAQFISQDFIKSPTYKQNTLYKMKWNPAYFVGDSRSPHQYATDIGWAYKQVRRISDMYNLLDSYNLYLDIPTYK